MVPVSRLAYQLLPASRPHSPTLAEVGENSPVEFEVEASLHGSSLNLNLPDWCGAMDFCDGYEAPAKKR
jgi:hypothetical protein